VPGHGTWLALHLGPGNIRAGRRARSVYGLAEVRFGSHQFLHRTGNAHAALEADFIARLPCAIGKLKGRGFRIRRIAVDYLLCRLPYFQLRYAHAAHRCS